jgi:hypothetical protein
MEHQKNDNIIDLYQRQRANSNYKTSSNELRIFYEHQQHYQPYLTAATAEASAAPLQQQHLMFIHPQHYSNQTPLNNTTNYQFGFNSELISPLSQQQQQNLMTPNDSIKINRKLEFFNNYKNLKRSHADQLETDSNNNLDTISNDGEDDEEDHNELSNDHQINNNNRTLNDNKSNKCLKSEKLAHYNNNIGDLKCVVCSAQANGYNFDAITCESCKAFFRRNAFRSIVN